MASNFPIDDGNLSFSGDEFEGGLFLTQSTFSDVNTQKVEDAVDFLGGLEDVELSELSQGGKEEVESAVIVDGNDPMCEKVFDFGEEVDNGWTVSTQNDPIIVTRNHDGKKFVVDTSDTKHDEGVKMPTFEEMNPLPAISRELEADLKRFKSVVKAVDLENSKNKRYVNFYYNLHFMVSLVF